MAYGNLGGARDIGTTRLALATWAASLDEFLRRSNALAKAYAGYTAQDFTNLGYGATDDVSVLVAFITALPALPSQSVIQTALTYADKFRDIAG